MADALLPEQHRAPCCRCGSRRATTAITGSATGSSSSAKRKSTSALQVEIAARREQRAEAVFRQMLELDPAGQRFRQLLDLVDDAAGERGVGEESFPFVGQVGAEIGDDGVARAGVVKLRALQHVPVDVRRSALSRSVAPNGTTAIRRRTVPLGVDVEQIEPGDVEQEAGGEPDAVVGEAGQHEPDDDDAVAGQRRRQDHRASADARVGLDRQPHPEGDARPRPHCRPAC